MGNEPAATLMSPSPRSVSLMRLMRLMNLFDEHDGILKRKKPTIQERIAKYLEAIPGAIAGAGGHKQTFKVACSLYNGWALSEEETLAWLKVYNAKCQPPWSDRELERTPAY
jgi:hypothetical protein